MGEERYWRSKFEEIRDNPDMLDLRDLLQCSPASLGPSKVEKLHKGKQLHEVEMMVLE
jgi:hypothetical protein